MASISENVKDGKVVSYKFKACLGREKNSKQIFKCITWYPPENLTLAKIPKAAKVEADIWEREARQAFIQEQKMAEYQRTHYTFSGFVNDVWFPLCVRDGSHRASTIAFYGYALKIILPYFDDVFLHEITGIKVNEYLNWLRTKYRTKQGKPLAEKTIRHHYGLLSVIFNYAELQEIITKNPIKRVERPKVTKKPVDALDEEEAAAFLKAVEGCNLDFRCLLQTFITTGLRRSECLGLQWRDIDLDNLIIHVERSATYTKESGIVVAAPKTATSVRTVPIMASMATLLKQLRQQAERQYPDAILDCAFVFGSPADIFAPRDPNAVTRHLNRFIKANGLPNVSPHDLRHTCASLLLSSGANIKSVQEILGHADASTTLNYYVKTDIKQMRTATDKFAAAFNL
ncbi:MAG: site-specific integrase [Oscillospiraceae bacterium]|nr:site-specific integrase [Oscillospiraceae bacterium]